MTRIQQKLQYVVDAENVIIRTPYHKSIEEITEIVRGKANWIRTKQAEYNSESPVIVRPVFEEGSTLPYLGCNYPLRIVNVQEEIKSNENIKLVNGEFLIFSKSSRPPKKRTTPHIRVQLSSRTRCTVSHMLVLCQFTLSLKFLITYSALEFLPENVKSQFI
ncbi:MAG: M48 family metallopeptidase [Thermoproteota archaeon]|nr:M48 family metallopeptidase [Thermoproteota archaeon]